MTLLDRISGPTPTFFKKLRMVGLSLVAISAAIMGSPIALPAGIIAAAGYSALAGGVIAAVSQTTMTQEPDHKPE